MQEHPALGCLLTASIALVLLIGSGIAFCVGNPQYYNAKYERPSATRLPSKPIAFFAEKQTEPHTCGFHACSTIYKAYDLDPAKKNLRFRLGTDKPGTNFDPESLGTIHPDIVRVLAQDGFETNVLWQPASSDGEAIRAHLASGHPVLAMIRVKGLHWVVLVSGDNGMTRVYDSLKKEVEKVDTATFVKERVLGAILVKPAAN